MAEITSSPTSLHAEYPLRFDVEETYNYYILQNSSRKDATSEIIWFYSGIRYCNAGMIWLLLS